MLNRSPMKPRTEPRLQPGGGGQDDWLVHTLPHNTPVEPGRKALCGTRIRGIPISRASGNPLCTMCESLRKDGGLL